jgi:hypothetical protein
MVTTPAGALSLPVKRPRGSQPINGQGDPEQHATLAQLSESHFSQRTEQPQRSTDGQAVDWSEPMEPGTRSSTPREALSERPPVAAPPRPEPTEGLIPSALTHARLQG